MSAIRVRHDTWTDPPPPKESNPPKAKTLARIALQGRDPDGDILKLELTGSDYGAYRLKLFARDPHCIYCGCKLKESASTLDHQLPKSRGGINAPWNLWLACNQCNVTKGSRTALEWLEAIHGACVTMGLIEQDEEPEPDEEPDPADWWRDGGSSG